MFQTAAPAKINLYLHVTGRREDGYHFLDSLVAFANVGDSLSLEKDRAFSFALDGPLAAGLKEQDSEKNLVVRAARLLGKELGKEPDFKLTLTKNLPLASGIGGGSTDAAAALRVMAAYWKMAPDAPALHRIAASLGQDVPCCLAAQSCYFQGIGDETESAPPLPYVDMVLVNPLREVPTPSVFKLREGPFGAPSERWTEGEKTALQLVDWLSRTRNDLIQPALHLCPQIKEILDALAGQEGVLLSRMSGSGATCFGLFTDRGAAKKATTFLHESHPYWWVVQAHLPASPPLVLEKKT